MHPCKLPFVIAAFIAPLAVHAFSVNPMSVEIDPDQPNAQKLFVLSNTADKDVPVEVRVARPVMDDAGVETLEMGVGEDQFVILPQQLVLPAGGRRSVKVAYVGDNDGSEQTYRILFRQVPVDLEKPEEEAPADRPTFNMKVVLEYHTRIWITPKGLRERIGVKSFARKEALLAVSEQSPDGATLTAAEPRLQPALELVVANSGNRHGYLLEPRATMVTQDGREIVLPDESIKPLLGQVVLAGRERTFLLPLSPVLPEAGSIREIRLSIGKP